MTRDDGYTRYTVRIPTPLYERVKASAGEKSVNAEIVATLETAYPAPLPEAEIFERARGIAERLALSKDLDAREASALMRVLIDSRWQRTPEVAREIYAATVRDREKK